MSDDEQVPEESATDEPATDESATEALASDGPVTDDAALAFRVMDAETVTFELSDASPHVHLMEAEAPFRNLSIPIALPEAQALYLALNGAAGRRPGTHELTTSILRATQADVIAARIVRFEGGVYYAELDLMTPRGREVLDCRTSDAIILALRQTVPAPILCAEEILAAN